MLTFINLSILTALLAVTIPLLIHLFNRQRKKKIHFGSIRFLKFLEKQRLKRLKLYEYLLIIIRSLIILMLILAFARPTLTTKPVISSQGARTTAVILLDSGLNMRRYDDSGNRYLRAIELLDQIKRNYNPEDQVFIIPTTNPEKVLVTKGEIQQQRASFESGYFGSSFITALNLFNDHPNFNEELYIISDFQFWENEFKQHLQKFSNINLYCIKIGNSPVYNVGIDTIEIKSQILEINKPVNMEVTLRSSSSDKNQPVELHMFVNNNRVSHRRIMIGSNSTEVVPMSFLPQKSGFTSGYIEINDDDLLADNRYYFVVNIPAEIKILFVDDNPSPFLLAAMQSLSKHATMSLSINKFNTWAGQNFQKFDIIWLSNSPNLSNQIQNRIKNYMDEGGTLVLMPGLNTIPSEFNILTKKLHLPVQLTEVIQTKSSQEFYSFRQPDLEHPLFNGLFRTSDPDIEAPRFYRYFKIIAPSIAKRILSFQNGDPFLLQLDNREGLSFLFSSYIDDEWTDFQYRGLFLPILSRLIYIGISASSQTEQSTRVGKERIVVTKNHRSASKFYIQDSEGEKSTIFPKIIEQTYQFKLSQLIKPGLYQIHAENQVISIIPVNCDISLINEPFVDLQSMTETIPQIKLFTEDQEFTEAIRQARFGMELWKLCVILSLILIVVELLFVKNMEGKRRG